MTIKKTHLQLVELLNSNKELKVKDIMSKILILAETSSVKRTDTYILDVDNKVVAIHCWYNKQWLSLVGSKAVAFGSKQNAVTKLNTMCKSAVNRWTKQQADFKKAQAALLNDVANEVIDIKTMKVKLKEAELARLATVLTEEHCFDKKADIIKYLQDNKVKITDNKFSK